MVYAKDGTSVPSTKSTQLNKYALWTEEEKQILITHPDMTAEELCGLLPNRGVYAIRHMRSRMGRWSHSRNVCSVCGEHLIWRESMAARRLKLCKRCYLREMDMREEEEAHANALRQKQFKERRRRARRK